MFHFVRHHFFLPASWKRVFWITSVFITLAAGLFWLDFFRGYRAEVTVLVISRSGSSQSGAEIAGNLASLTRTLSFYDRMLSQNDLLDDAFESYAPDARRAHWNDAVSVKKFDGSSVLVVRAKGDTGEAARLLATETAQTLFSVAGFYYDIRTDVDLRIIDGPIVSYVVASPIFFAGVSLSTGLFVTVLFFWLLNAVPGFIGGRKESVSLDEFLAKQSVFGETAVAPEKSHSEFTVDESAPWIDPRKFVPTKPATLSFESASPETKKNTPSVPHAAAPANLPVASDEMNLPLVDVADLPFTFETSSENEDRVFSQDEEDESSKSKIAVPEAPDTLSVVTEPVLPKSEPTVEDYKRRLNELLAGSK